MHNRQLKPVWLWGTLVATWLSAIYPAMAEDGRVVALKASKAGAIQVVHGRIKGDAYVDYRLRAEAGQMLAVDLQTRHFANYFNVLPPGRVSAMFIGSTSGNSFRRLLPVDGEYTLRVYLMRSAARRGEVADFRMSVGVTGKSWSPVSSSVDAVLPGTPFHASALVPCHVAQCESFVIRRGFDGTGTVEIRWREGELEQIRRVLFKKGRVVSSDGVQLPEAVRQGDMTVLRFDDGASVEIPDALLTGG